MVIQYLLCLGVAFIVSAITVYFRDMEQIMGVVMMAWIYVTPVMYNRYWITIIKGRYTNVLRWNPNPETSTAKKTMIKLNNMLTNALVTYEMGITSLGKYIFLTISDCARIHVVPPCTDVPKKVHGIIPMIR